MGGADPGRGAPRPAQRSCVVELEHPLADRDDGQRPAVVDRRHAARLRRDRDAPRDAALADHRQRVAALVADRVRAAGQRGEVVRVGPDAHALQHPPRGQADREEGVRRLRRHEHGATGTGQRQVPRPPGQRDRAAHLAVTAVDECQAGGLAQADRQQAGDGVGDDALGLAVERQHPARRLVRGHRRPRGLGGQRQVAHAARPTARGHGHDAEDQQRGQEGQR